MGKYSTASRISLAMRGAAVLLIALALVVEDGGRAAAENIVDPSSAPSMEVAPRDPETGEPGPSPSRSLGLPWEGRLVNGVWLAPSRTIRHLPRFASRGNFYGTHELVGMLQRTADVIARRWPGSRLTVGELSAGVAAGSPATTPIATVAMSIWLSTCATPAVRSSGRSGLCPSRT